jgi:hypothetical protein
MAASSTVHIETPRCQSTAFCGTAGVGKTGNNAIFEMVRSPYCNPALHPSRLCIGAASISMTPAREETMDFLPTYFSAGLQILATKEMSSSRKAWNFTVALAGLFLGIICALVAGIIMLIPAVFFLETTMAQSKISIFYVGPMNGPCPVNNPRLDLPVVQCATMYY